MSRVFPQYSDGDVEIHLTGDHNDTLVLHSYVLALHSSWFKAALSHQWTTTNLMDASGRKRWVYELRFDKDSLLGMLTRVATPATGAENELIFLGSKAKLVTNNETERAVHEQRLDSIKSHHELFGTFYHLLPAFSHQSFERARESISDLCAVADIYDCRHIVKVHIENHLRLYRTEVLDTCASEPVDMLELATKVQSEWIFMEAVTNLLGRSQRRFDIAQPKLIELGISDLLYRKRNEFEDRLRQCEYDLFIMQMDEEAAHDRNEQGGLNFFRQWLSEQIIEGNGSRLGPGYAWPYHTIAKKKLSTKMAMHKKSMSDYLGSMNKLNASVETFAADEVNPVIAKAADIVAPLLKDVTRRQDKTVDAYRALTFMGVSDDELPWVKKA